MDTMFCAAKKSRGSLQVTAAKDKKGKLMWEALREAVDEEMEKDPNVCVIGTLQPLIRQNLPAQHLTSTSYIPISLVLYVMMQ